MALHGGEALSAGLGPGCRAPLGWRVWSPPSAWSVCNLASLPQDYEVHDCLKQLMMSLLRLYRFSPIVPDLSLQVRARATALSPWASPPALSTPSPQTHYLRLTIAILRHEKSRKFLLSNVLYPSLAACQARGVSFAVSRGQGGQCASGQGPQGGSRGQSYPVCKSLFQDRPPSTSAKQGRQGKGPGWLSSPVRGLQMAAFLGYMEMWGCHQGLPLQPKHCTFIHILGQGFPEIQVSSPASPDCRGCANRIGGRVGSGPWRVSLC